MDREFVERYAAWIHIDFLPIGNVDASVVDQELRAFTYRRIRESLLHRFRDDIAADGGVLRAVFAVEINDARLTVLHGVDEESAEWNGAVNQLVDRLFQDDERFVFAAIRRLRSQGRRIAVVLDNTDQLGEAFQERVFLFAQKLAADYLALCVVTLREEKFFAAYRQGKF